MSRIPPLDPPYPPEVEARLTAMMPPGVEPIRLFRTFVRNLPMTTAMAGWGGYELGRELSLTMREREIVIDRTCARCACQYEWAVHLTYFADRVELSAEQVISLATGGPQDPCWTDERDRVLIAACDGLHERADIDDEVWARLARQFTDDQLLDMLLLAGWYHAICYVANAARVEHEPRATVTTALSTEGRTT